jgi:hypothetical protein
VTMERAGKGAAGRLIDGRIWDEYPAASPPAQLVDVVSGPHTIVALGEDCLVCEEGLEPGAVCVFCRDAAGCGVTHESCTDDPALALLR